ncbi:MAG: hypothetical protein LM583_08785, partial [Desulfurococcaceae archaeon]|nr:hypothetical protein [Desulfurococcaceae archaeon]
PVPPHVESYVSDTLNNVKSQISALESIGLKGVKVNIAVFKSQVEVDAVKNDIESAGVEDKYKQVIALQKFTSVAEVFKWVLEVVKEELSKGLGASQGL